MDGPRMVIEYIHHPRKTIPYTRDANHKARNGCREYRDAAGRTWGEGMRNQMEM